jgi:hypothetical protein
VVNKRSTSEFWRVTTFALLAVGLVAMVMAMAYILIFLRTVQTSFRMFGSIPLTEPFKAFLIKMAVVVGALFIFSIFCTAALVIRYFGHRMRLLQSRHEPTEYVDAWRIAGERLETPAADDGTGDGDIGEGP